MDIPLKSKLVFASLVPFIALVTACGSAPAAQISCRDVEYGKANYNDKMDELARLAHLPENAWNRYDESLVHALCGGEIKEVDKLVNDGFVKPAAANAVARVLGKAYTSKAPTLSGASYASARKKLITLGACSACADNIAQHYSKTPNSQCGKLAHQALDGDTEAIKKVVQFPDYCKWTY